MPERARLRVGVLASGRGSNFRALVAAARGGRMPADVVVLISDRAEAGAVALAHAEGIEVVVIPPREHPGRDAHDKAVTDALEARRVGLVCLAGYMRILGADFVEHFRGRLLNIHPALLPAFPGLHAQRQALAHGVRVGGRHRALRGRGHGHGSHRAAGGGPGARRRHRGHAGRAHPRRGAPNLPEAVRLFAEGRLQIDGRRVRIKEGA
jgi:phosphoribosylglycinamide formyltransferase-1